MLINKQIQDGRSKDTNLNKTTLKEKYSSDSVDLLSKDEIKELLVKEKLI